MFEGFMSDDSIMGCYLVGSVISVDKERHLVNIQPYRFTESLSDVPLLRDSGNYSLPEENDIAFIIFDDREKPVVIATYPQFISDLLKDNQERYVRPGEVRIATKLGGQLVISNNKFLGSSVIRLVDRLDNGLEVDGGISAIFMRGFSEKNTFATKGVIERAGICKRRGMVSISGTTTVFDNDNEEDFVRKVGTLSSPGVISSLVGDDIYEKKIEIKKPGSVVPLVTPEGINLYEETIATVIVEQNTVTGTYTEDLHSETSLPLRKKTIFYDVTGQIELIKEEVDCLGNIKLSISVLATVGLKIATDGILTPVPTASLGNIVTNITANNDPITGIPLQGIRQLSVGITT